MKSVYSVTHSFSPASDENAHHPNSTAPINPHATPAPVEGAILFCVAVLGLLGNAFIMVVTLTCQKFRHMSSAFLFHHCLLDAVKSTFCFPFGYSLLMQNAIPHCDVLGAAYILLMTVSAYNLLALLLNEEYQCPYIITPSKNGQKGGGGGYGRKKGDSCCIAFGVVVIWFTTVLLHLGVAFLPGSAEFSQDIGNCVYRYGVTKNYVIHALWVILVTGAIIVASLSFIHFYRKLQLQAKSRRWTSLHKSLSSLRHNYYNHATTTTTTTSFGDFRNNGGGGGNDENGEVEEIHYDFHHQDANKFSEQGETSIAQTQQHYNHHHHRYYMRRSVLLLLMLVSFVVCWYPLFLLTLLDVHFHQPTRLYRMLMVLAWSQPLCTPVFCALIYFKVGVWSSARSSHYINAAIPMNTHSYSHTNNFNNNSNHSRSSSRRSSGDGGGGNGNNGNGSRSQLNHHGSMGNLTFLNHNFFWGPNPNHTDDTRQSQQHRQEVEEEEVMEEAEVLMAERRQSTPKMQCETVTNYSAEERACHTLIM